jgi:hypothetical protein
VDENEDISVLEKILCLILLYIDNTNMGRARNFDIIFEFVTSSTLIPVPENYVTITLKHTAIV